MALLLCLLTMKRLIPFWLLAASTGAFVIDQHGLHRLTSHLFAGGEGGDSEWAKALFENSGEAMRNFESDMKMKGLMKGNAKTNPKLSANQNLIQWLTEEGEVYLVGRVELGRSTSSHGHFHRNQGRNHQRKFGTRTLGTT